MKRTEIHYTEDNGRITVVGIKHAATYNEIEKEFGSNAMNAYREWCPRYIRNVQGNVTILGISAIHDLIIHMTYSKEGFQHRIALMKQAGDNLAKAIAESKKLKIIKI